MIRWMSFPKNYGIEEDFRKIVEVFEDVENDISSSTKTLESNKVLKCVAPGLKKLGYEVEEGKKKADIIHVPVLYGENGTVERAFIVDAYHKQKKIVIEVEAGRAVVNYQFLKDYYEACVMQDVEYLCIAVRQTYRNKKDFDTVVSFFETIYASNKISTQLKKIMILGY